MKIMLHWQRTHAHRRCTVSVGLDRDHLAYAGTLTFTPQDADLFRATVRAGIFHTGFDGIFEEGWS